MSKELRKWMPMFWPQYLADTRHLSTTEHGAYLLLIAHYWMTGGVPWENERLVQRITGMDNRQWRRSRDILRSFFDCSGGHKRVDEELGYAIEKSKRLSANAKLRHSKSRPIADTPTPTPTKKENNTNYYFEDGVIRLNQADFEKWQDAFPNLDLKAELLGLSSWASTQANWFHAVKGALAKRNREHRPRQTGTKTTEDILNPTNKRAAWGLP